MRASKYEIGRHQMMQVTSFVAVSWKKSKSINASFFADPNASLSKNMLDHDNSKMSPKIVIF